MDPFEIDHPGVIEALGSYLLREMPRHRQVEGILGSNAVIGIYAQVPWQDQDKLSDPACGIHMFHYINTIFNSDTILPDQFLTKIIGNEINENSREWQSHKLPMGLESFRVIVEETLSNRFHEMSLD
ncbi:hypothetical protein EC991_001647 [Linnemannia zychae]|nr:hypothetical protein EC991_001647 [Linnemannia zychae]